MAIPDKLDHGGSPAIAADGTVYLASTDSYVYAINPGGTLKWRGMLGKYATASPNIGSDGTIYVGATNGTFYALGPGDGSVEWSYNTTGSVIASTAAIGPGGGIYFGCEDSYLYGLPGNGQFWRYKASKWVDSSPSVDSSGNIYAASTDGKLFSVTSSGGLRWSYAVGTGIHSSPAIGVDGTIYIGCDDYNLYAFNPNGGVKWRYHTGGAVQSSPAVGGDGTIYVGSLDDSLYAINPNGTLLWQYYLAGAVSNSPAIGPNGTLYVGSADKNLYAFTIDRTPPTTPVVVDDGRYTTSATSLHATWSSSNPETGVAAYQYAIGTSAGGTDVVGWTSAGTATQVTQTGLVLTNGVTYYFAVKSKNGVGLWSAVGTSDGITVDYSLPATPVVVTGGAYTAVNTSLTASWSSSDPYSGIVQYQYAIGTSAGGANVVGWTSAGSATQATVTGLTLANGVTYYFSVKAMSGAGLWSAVGSSSGITVDYSVPTTPVVLTGGAYTAVNTSLTASWSSSDPYSGIAQYQYAIGTSAGGTNVAGWTSAGSATQATATGLTLANGAAYYFSVKAMSGAGLWSAVGTSSAITIDTSPPSTPVVVDDGAYTTSPNTLHATWSSTDPESGIAQYQYAIGTSASSADVAGWTSAGAATGVTRTGLSLTNGVTYYFSVKALNGANVWSAVGTSDGITVDCSVPTTPVVALTGGRYTAVNTSLTASWSSSDPYSGIAQYQYAIGTSAGGTDVVGWTSAGIATQATAAGVTLANGVTYYFSVKAMSGAGLWSAAGSSSGVTVDTSQPTTPVVVLTGGAYTAVNTSLTASWSSTDPYSGIAQYQYAIGTSAGGADVVGWTSAVPPARPRPPA